ncbi:type IV fimbrial biogenesis protein FimT [Noviherbaspirillum suwonense]|uniref:Type II secretion system protein H n=1 Tax=Noviherbaspirillum suwonense TaxID=1224511 RepID=A0ABY1Q620_9BURK|nr:type IV fimbrial biogenesis protein FimT [Noviherbaspirillum suwonense]
MKPSRGGHTLVEMLSVLAIAAILAGLAMPSLQRMLQQHRLNATVNEFLAAVTLARSEAVRRGAQVMLLPAGDGWGSGWVVAVDRNANRRYDAGDELLYSHGPAAAGVAIDGSFTDDSQPYMAYGAGGLGRSRTGAAQAGSWQFSCGGQRRSIIVNLLGRPRSCNPDTGRPPC